MGFVVPKFTHSAVQRNQLKRRLRELARLRLLPMLPPIDVVIRARREAYDASFAALTVDVDRIGSELPRLFAR